LNELEDNLQALVNSIDLALEPAIREFILEKTGQEVRRVKEKRVGLVCRRITRQLNRCELPFGSIGPPSQA
jgi:hypothetical protein